MNLNALSKAAHGTAVNKGFWEHEISIEHSLCLVVSEVCEAVEADRHNKHHDVAHYKKAGETIEAFKHYMKDSVEDELADVVIRLLDLAGDLQLDFDMMSDSRYFRAFGRWDFCDNAFALIKGLSRDNVNVNRRIIFGISFVQHWAEHLKFDLHYAIIQKMKYNESREIRNGKRY